MSLRTVRILLWLPLVAFLTVLALVAAGLIKPHDSTIRSQMVDKPLPAFSLPLLGSGAPLDTTGRRADRSGSGGVCFVLDPAYRDQGLVNGARTELMGSVAAWYRLARASPPSLAELISGARGVRLGVTRGAAYSIQPPKPATDGELECAA